MNYKIILTPFRLFTLIDRGAEVLFKALPVNLIAVESIGEYDAGGSKKTDLVGTYLPQKLSRSASFWALSDCRTKHQ